MVDGDFVEKHRDIEIFLIGVKLFFCFFKDLVDIHVFIGEDFAWGAKWPVFLKWNDME